jgi:hypothetical protein
MDGRRKGVGSGGGEQPSHQVTKEGGGAGERVRGDHADPGAIKANQGWRARDFKCQI